MPAKYGCVLLCGTLQIDRFYFGFPLHRKIKGALSKSTHFGVRIFGRSEVFFFSSGGGPQSITPLGANWSGLHSGFEWFWLVFPFCFFRWFRFSSLGFPLGSLWVPFGFPLGSLWVPFGFPLGSLWVPFGFPLGSFWVPFGVFYGFHLLCVRFAFGVLWFAFDFPLVSFCCTGDEVVSSFGPPRAQTSCQRSAGPERNLRCNPYLATVHLGLVIE